MSQGTDLAIAINSEIPVVRFRNSWFVKHYQHDEAIEFVKGIIFQQLAPILGPYYRTDNMDFLRKLAGVIADSLPFFSRQGLALEEFANGLAAYFAVRDISFSDTIPFRSNDPAERADELAAMIKSLVYKRHELYKQEVDKEREGNEFPRSASDRFIESFPERPDTPQPLRFDIFVSNHGGRMVGQDNHTDEQVSEYMLPIGLLAFKELLSVTKPENVIVDMNGEFHTFQLSIHEAILEGARQEEKNYNFSFRVASALIPPAFQLLQQIMRDERKPLNVDHVFDTVIKGVGKATQLHTGGSADFMEIVFEDPAGDAATKFKVAFKALLCMAACDLAQKAQLEDASVGMSPVTVEATKAYITQLATGYGHDNVNGATMHEAFKSAARLEAYSAGHDISASFASRNRGG